MENGLLARIDRIESTLAIQQLPIRYALAVDGRDIDAWISLFVEDVDCGRYGNGREALRATIEQPLTTFYRSIHQICGHRIAFVDADHATGQVYCRAEHEDRGKWVVMAICYFDDYARRGGEWQFVRRRERHWYSADVLDRPSAPFQRWEGHDAPPKLPGAFPTWGAFGIGQASAMALAQDGARVVVADINVDAGEAVARDICGNGGKALFIRADAAIEADVAMLVERVVAEFGGLDCAHNNVGLGKSGPTITTSTIDEWDWTMNLSLKSTWLAMKYQIPVMLSAGDGAIVNTASMAGVQCTPAASPAYSAAKAGVIHLTKYASQAYAGQGPLTGIS